MTVGIDFTTMLKLNDFVKLFSKLLKAKEKEQEQTLRQLPPSDDTFEKVLEAFGEVVSRNGKFFFTNHRGNREREGETPDERKIRLSRKLIREVLKKLYPPPEDTDTEEDIEDVPAVEMITDDMPDDEMIHDAYVVLSGGGTLSLIHI